MKSRNRCADNLMKNLLKWFFHIFFICKWLSIPYYLLSYHKASRSSSVCRTTSWKHICSAQLVAAVQKPSLASIFQQILHDLYGHVNITLQPHARSFWAGSTDISPLLPAEYLGCIVLKQCSLSTMSPGKQKFSVVSCAINSSIFLPSDLTFSIMIKERFLAFPCCWPNCCPFLVALFSRPFVLPGFLFCLFTQYLSENVWDDLSVICCVLPQQDQLVTCVLALAVWEEPK